MGDGDVTSDGVRVNIPGASGAGWNWPVVIMLTQTTAQGRGSGKFKLTYLKSFYCNKLLAQIGAIFKLLCLITFGPRADTRALWALSWTPSWALFWALSWALFRSFLAAKKSSRGGIPAWNDELQGILILIFFLKRSSICKFKNNALNLVIVWVR